MPAIKNSPRATQELDSSSTALCLKIVHTIIYMFLRRQVEPLLNMWSEKWDVHQCISPSYCNGMLLPNDAFISGIELGHTPCWKIPRISFPGKFPSAIRISCIVGLVHSFSTNSSISAFSRKEWNNYYNPPPRLELLPLNWEIVQFQQILQVISITIIVNYEATASCKLCVPAVLGRSSCSVSILHLVKVQLSFIMNHL